MPVATKTLGVIINAALKEVGEPEITEFTSSNILQQRLIEVSNNATRELVDRLDYTWRLQRTTISTNADITTESAHVINGDATVNSVTSDGDDADNWGSASTSMWFRASGTQKSYQISSITTSGSPDTLELETAYLDDTNTAVGYRIFQDSYGISTSGFGDLVEASYGDSASWSSAMGGVLPDDRLIKKTFPDLMALAGGDRHRDTSGRPRVIAEIGVDSSNNPQFVLWPYPNDTYLIELWYSVEFTENSTFSTVMFGNDAPSSAYDYIEHKTVAAAHLWDENTSKAAVYEQMARNAFDNILRRENREKIGTGFTIETNRRRYGGRYPARSGILFDTAYRR